MSAIDQATVKELARLYEKRDRLTDAKLEADRPGWWSSFFEHVGAGNGTHSSMMGSLGGRQEMVTALGDACVTRLEALIAAIEDEIETLGGQP